MEAAKAPRKRMAAQERRQNIVDSAIRFFAENGFQGSTRDLTRAMGVSQALLFKYFTSKEDLIEEVYRQNFLSRWKMSWLDDLRDRNVDFRSRLTAFYLAYTEAIDDRHWLRITLLSGLANVGLSSRYINETVGPILCTIVNELNAERPDRPVTSYTSLSELPEADLELVWHLHSTVLYYFIRKHIFGVRVSEDPATMVAGAIDTFLGALAT